MQPVNTAALNTEEVSNFIKIINDYTDDHVPKNLHLPVFSLKFLTRKKWLSSDLINFYIQLVNRSVDDTHALYLNDMITSRPHSFVSSFSNDTRGKKLRKIIFCVNVGRKDNKTFGRGLSEVIGPMDKRMQRAVILL